MLRLPRIETSIEPAPARTYGAFSAGGAGSAGGVSAGGVDSAPGPGAGASAGGAAGFGSQPSVPKPKAAAATSVNSFFMVFLEKSIVKTNGDRQSDTRIPAP